MEATARQSLESHSLWILLIRSQLTPRSSATERMLPNIKRSKAVRAKNLTDPVLALQKGQSRPPAMPTAVELEAVEQKIRKASLSPKGAHPKKSSFLSFETGFPIVEHRAFYILICHSDIDGNTVLRIVRGFIVVSFQPKGMAIF